MEMELFSPPQTRSAAQPDKTPPRWMARVSVGGAPAGPFRRACNISSTTPLLRRASHRGHLSEMWDWQSQEFDLKKDLLPAPSTSLWAEANHNEVDSWSLFHEQTPIKECTDIDLPFCDIGG